MSAELHDIRPIIETRGLVRRFGDKVAVAGIDLAVPRGSFFGFLGPNGAGKTTTVRMLTGLLAPTEGEALIGGRSIREHPVEIKRRIGVVPDTLALFDRLSLWEHVTLVGRVHGLSKSETESRGEELLTLLGLWEDRGVYATDASHGMRKKTALAIALLHAPDVLFLDEPFEGIDPIAGKVLRDLLRLMSSRGTTIFLTSHILEIIERLVDRVAVIVRGRIELVDSLENLQRGGRTLEEAFITAAGADQTREVDLSWLHRKTD
jgi:ABC-2 type transport system ATP-binding protein